MPKSWYDGYELAIALGCVGAFLGLWFGSFLWLIVLGGGGAGFGYFLQHQQGASS